MTDQYGQAHPGPVAWRSSAPSVFSVDSRGGVRALSNGEGVVAATAGDLSAEAAVVVEQVPSTVALVSGGDQRVLAGRTLRESVVVSVRDAGGATIPGVALTFVPGEGQGTADPAAAETGPMGLASTSWTLGAETGSASMVVSAENGPRATVLATALTPDQAADSLAAEEGEDQRKAVGHSVAVAVRVLDEGGEHVPGATIRFAPNNGTVNPAAGLTGAAGVARTRWTLGAQTGKQTLVASIDDGGPRLEFAAVAVTPEEAAADVDIVSGDEQTAVRSATLPDSVVFLVVDDAGDPVQGALVSLTADGGGTASPVSAETDANGVVAVSWTLGAELGSQTLVANVADGPFAAAEALAITPGQAVHAMEVVHGPGQGRYYVEQSIPITVRVVDAAGRPVPDATVAFVPSEGHGTPHPDTTLTDADGVASTSWSLSSSSGEHRLSAVVPNGPETASALFAARAVTPDAAADTIVLASGGNRRAAVRQTIPVAFTVLDETGAPVPGATVIFGPGDGNGTVDPATAETTPDGIAATEWTLGHEAGDHLLAASITKGATAHARVVVVDPDEAADTIATADGVWQDRIAASNNSVPVVVRVMDEYGEPVPGATVSFVPGASSQGSADLQEAATAEAAHGTVDPASATTDENGEAGTTWTLGETTGLQVLMAQVANGPALQIGVTAVAPNEAVDSLEIVSGGGQTGLQGHALPEPIEVRVVDEAGVPVRTAQVWFRPHQDHGHAAPAARFATDSTGAASATWVLGLPLGEQKMTISVPDGPEATVTATAVKADDAAHSIEVLSGPTPVAAVGYPIKLGFRVLSATAKGVPGATVAFEPAEGHGTAQPVAASTNDQGFVATTWTPAPEAGSQVLTAAVPGGPSVVVTATILVPDLTIAVDAEGASGREMPVGVYVTDPGGTPVPGVDVEFEPDEGHGTTDPGSARTDSSGLAAVTWTPLGDVIAKTSQSITVRMTSGPSKRATIGIESGICDRTPQVSDAIVFYINAEDPSQAFDTTCSDVQASQIIASGQYESPLAMHVLVLSPPYVASIDSLKSFDFDGMFDLISLDLSSNDLSELPQGIFDDVVLGQLRLADNRLDNSIFSRLIHTSELTLLDLTKNNLTKLSASDFPISDSTHFEALEILSLADNQIREVSSDAFSNLISLRALSLADNDFRLRPNTFAQQADLRTLILRNAVNGIDPGSFNGLSSVTDVVIANNPRLNSLEPGTFEGLSKLENLQLDNTGITTIDAGAFDGLDSLSYLSIKSSKLEVIQNDAFRGMPLLQTLEMHNNPRLTSLSESAFADLTALTALTIEDGNIAHVSSGMLDSLSNLQILSLTNNNIDSLPSNAFRGPMFLLRIDLSNNNITDVSPSIFADQVTLPILQLAGNRLSSYPKDLIMSLPLLQAVDLSNNRITNMPADAFSGLSNVFQELWLHGNPGAPFPLSIEIGPVGTGAPAEGEGYVWQARHAGGASIPFSVIVDWTATGDVIGRSKGQLVIPPGSLASGTIQFSGDNNGAPGGATVMVTTNASVPDGIKGFEPHIAENILTVDFVADPSRTNRRPIGSRIADVELIVDDDSTAIDANASFSDPDGDILMFSGESSDTMVVRTMLSTSSSDTIFISPVGVGEAVVDVIATDPSGFQATQAVKVVVLRNFDIEIVFVGGVSPDHQEVFERAERTWESIITRGIEFVDFSENPYPAGQCMLGQPAVTDTIQALRIFAQMANIDGPLGTLAAAGPCAQRGADSRDRGLPVIGQMRFDLDDLYLLASGRDGLYSVVLHEMAHVLGVGTIWHDKELLRDPSLVTPGADTYFPGPLSIAAFDAAGGTSYKDGKKVPVENAAGPGSGDSHWRESVLDNELMTPRYNAGISNPLSAITIQSLADIGYTVNVAIADAYTLPSADFMKRRMPGRVIDLGADVQQGPITVVDRKGRVLAVRR